MTLAIVCIVASSLLLAGCTNDPCKELLLVMKYPKEKEPGPPWATNADFAGSAGAQKEALEKGGKETGTIKEVNPDKPLPDAVKGAVKESGSGFDSIEIFGHGANDGCISLPYDVKTNAPAEKPDKVCPSGGGGAPDEIRKHFFDALKAGAGATVEERC